MPRAAAARRVLKQLGIPGEGDGPALRKNSRAPACGRGFPALHGAQLVLISRQVKRASSFWVLSSSSRALRLPGLAAHGTYLQCNAALAACALILAPPRRRHRSTLKSGLEQHLGRVDECERCSCVSFRCRLKTRPWRTDLRRCSPVIDMQRHGTRVAARSRGHRGGKPAVAGGQLLQPWRYRALPGRRSVPAQGAAASASAASARKSASNAAAIRMRLVEMAACGLTAGDP